MFESPVDFNDLNDESDTNKKKITFKFGVVEYEERFIGGDKVVFG